MKNKIAFIILVLLSVSIIAQDNDQKKDTDSSSWELNVTPYIWFTGVQADLGFRDNELGQVQADFSDILKNIKMGGMFHTEASNGKWIIMGDLIYAKIKKDGSLDIGATPTKLELKELITELGLGYNIVNNDNTFLVDAFAGWRYIGVDNNLSIGTRIALDRTISANDPFVGARFKFKADDWTIGLRGDLGGFGFGTEISWKINTFGAYEFSELFSLYFGVQALGMDFEKKDVTLDIQTAGFAVGGNFKF